MQDLLAGISLACVNYDLIRNIVSLAHVQNVFDDLSDNPEEWYLAQQIEDEFKSYYYQSNTAIIHRPFEESKWFNAINYPFAEWKASRYSNGSFGVWYGSNTLETTIYETAYHWYHGLICQAGFQNEIIISERQYYAVSCKAALLNFRPLLKKHPELMHKTDYTSCQTIGSRLHLEGHPGILTNSVRHELGQNYPIFNPLVLTNPRLQDFLSYKLQNHYIHVEDNKSKNIFSIKI